MMSDFNGAIYPPAYREFRRDWVRLLDAMLAGEANGVEAQGWLAATAAADVMESEHDVRVWLDLPGVMPESVTLSIDGDRLHVEAQRRSPQVRGPHLAWRRERPSGRIRRSIRLPFEPEEDRIEATLANGVLLVTIGKTESPSNVIQMRLRTP